VAVTDDSDLDLRDQAIRALVDRRFDRAGDLYARAGHGTLAGLACEATGTDTLAPERVGRVGHGLRYLFLSALSARAAGAVGRARTRAMTGRLTAADLRRHVLTDPAQRAGLREFEADLAAAGSRETDPGSIADDAADAYDAAASAAESAATEVEDPTSWVTTHLFQAGYYGPTQAARNTALAFEWDDLHGSSPEGYFERRVRFKRARVPKVVAHVGESGSLHPPRGSTEHNSDDFRCPECGGNEVNWTAGLEICLDCSVELTRI
jgi:hypothetical protein